MIYQPGKKTFSTFQITSWDTLYNWVCGMFWLTDSHIKPLKLNVTYIQFRYWTVVLLYVRGVSPPSSSSVLSTRIPDTFDTYLSICTVYTHLIYTPLGWTMYIVVSNANRAGSHANMQTMYSTFRRHTSVPNCLDPRATWSFFCLELPPLVS